MQTVGAAFNLIPKICELFHCVSCGRSVAQLPDSVKMVSEIARICKIALTHQYIAFLRGRPISALLLRLSSSCLRRIGMCYNALILQSAANAIYRVVQKWHIYLYSLTSSNIDRFPNLFHCQNPDNICNNTVIKDPTTPQVCRYTTLIVKCQCLKSNNWNKTTTVTHIKSASSSSKAETAGCDSYFR